MANKTRSANAVSAGELRAWVLLLTADSAAYGWELTSRMREHGVKPDQAAIYRTLYALEAEGFVRAEWGPAASGPARRNYTITASGRRELDQRADQMAERRRTLTRFLRLYRSVASSPGPD